MQPNEYFYQILEIAPLYETEGIFFEPFWEFMYRFQSLQRHWQLSKEFINNHISILKRVEDDGTDLFGEAFSETAEVDVEYFPEYLKLSTLSISLALVENLLCNLGEEVAKDLNIEVELDKRQLPFINKYILFLVRGCGIEIDIDKNTWSSLDAIRAIRNRFIHQINRDIPSQIKKVISEMNPSVTEDKSIISNEFIDLSLSKLAKLVKVIELAYIKFHNNHKREG